MGLFALSKNAVNIWSLKSDLAAMGPTEKFRVLLLGASFDTRFYRFKEMVPNNVQLVEVCYLIQYQYNLP